MRWTKTTVVQSTVASSTVVLYRISSCSYSPQRISDSHMLMAVFLTSEGITAEPFLHVWSDVHEATKEDAEIANKEGVKIEDLLLGCKFMLKQVENGTYSPDNNVLVQARVDGERIGHFHAKMLTKRNIHVRSALTLPQPLPPRESRSSAADKTPVEPQQKQKPRSAARERVERSLARGSTPPNLSGPVSSRRPAERRR